MRRCHSATMSATREGGTRKLDIRNKIRDIHNKIKKVPSRREHKDNALGREVSKYCKSDSLFSERQLLDFQTKLLQELVRRCCNLVSRPVVIAGSATAYAAALHEKENSTVEIANSDPVLKILDCFFAQTDAVKAVERQLEKAQEDVRRAQAETSKVLEEVGLLKHVLAEKKRVEIPVSASHKVHLLSVNTIKPNTLQRPHGISSENVSANPLRNPLIPIMNNGGILSVTTSALPNCTRTVPIVETSSKNVMSTGIQTCLDASGGGQIADLKKELALCNNHIATLEAAVHKSRFEKTNAMVEKEKLVESLRAQVSDLATQRDHLRGKLTIGLSNLGAARTEMEDSKRREHESVQSAEKQVKEHRMQIQSLSEELAELQIKVSVLDKKLALKSEEVLTLNTNRGIEMANAREEKLQHEQQCKEMDALKHLKDKEQKTLKARLDDAKQLMKKTREMLEEDIERKNKDIVKRTAEVNKLKEQLITANMCLNVRREERNKENEEWKKRMLEAEEEINILKSHSSKENARFAAVMKQVAALQKKCSMYEESRRTSRAAMKRMHDTEKNIFLVGKNISSGKLSGIKTTPEMLQELFRLRFTAWKMADETHNCTETK